MVEGRKIKVLFLFLPQDSGFVLWCVSNNHIMNHE